MICEALPSASNHRVPQPGEMGSVTDTLSVVLGPGGAASALAGALVVWLRTRKPTVRLRLQSKSVSIDLTAKHLNDPEQLAEQLLEAAREL